MKYAIKLIISRYLANGVMVDKVFYVSCKRYSQLGSFLEQCEVFLYCDSFIFTKNFRVLHVEIYYPGIQDLNC